MKNTTGGDAPANEEVVVIKKKSTKVSRWSKLSPTSEENENVSSVLCLFRDSINPFIRFENVTQRVAALQLIRKIGFERTLALVRFAIAIQGRAYAPVITTPYELVDKVGKLQIFAAREQEQQKKQTFISGNQLDKIINRS